MRVYIYYILGRARARLPASGLVRDIADKVVTHSCVVCVYVCIYPQRKRDETLLIKHDSASARRTIANTRGR